MLKALDRNTHLGEMIGAWAGRQAEEELAQSFNMGLVDRLKDRWDADRGTGRQNEYVNLADPDLKDTVLKDTWKIIPAEMRNDIERVFGKNKFMVRKDMVNNALGYREASVGDPWTGISRLDPKAQKAFIDTASFFFGKDTFKYLRTAEEAWQAGISVAKNTIVIRSVIVPASNLASNFLQLTTRGIGPRQIYKGFREKLVEIDQFLKNQDRKVEIEALMAVNRNQDAMRRRLEAELDSIEESNRRMSIWPLIEAGEFSTISEGLTEADAAIGVNRH
ncbi:hypothetical protein [Maritimibacter dapengensis]|uniref:Uncharacterized protein n=1 Tax=Maritimibacter dapengensis TaxID=2836868 RepID=A0ABS6T380_9RHOB|nr:hypothetical protein [Maritimibacter dapengensis]MBV7379688.1 hypothetical protein [Maritimibacter dapengensis]